MVRLYSARSGIRRYVWASNGSFVCIGSILVEIASDSAGSNLLDSAIFGVNINDI